MEKVKTKEKTLDYTRTMPQKKADTMQTLPSVDVVELCKRIEKLKGYNQRQMSELLGVHLTTYQAWRYQEDREKSGEAVGRLFLLKEQVEKEFAINIPIPVKPKNE